MSKASPSYESVCSELQGHKITRVAGSAGSYEGRWMCKNAASGHSWFEVTTWPGYIVMTGDRGEFVFGRPKTNMVSFFSEHGCSQDLGYVHEKLQAADVRHDVSVFSERLWREVLEDELIECANYCDGEELEEREEKLRELIEEVPDSLDKAYELLREELDWHEDMPTLTVYSNPFVWAVRALAWFARNVQIEEMEK